MAFGDAQRLELELLAAIRYAQVGAEVEQVVLDAQDLRVEAWMAGEVLPHDAQRRIRLIDGAVSGDPGIILANAFAGAEPRGARIAGFV